MKLAFATGSGSGQILPHYAHRRRGKGNYAMRYWSGRRCSPLGSHPPCAAKHPKLDSMVIGCPTAAEVDFNLAVLEGRTPGLLGWAAGRGGAAGASTWPSGARGGQALRPAPQGALQLAGDKVTAQAERCVLCGYQLPRLSARAPETI